MSTNHYLFSANEDFPAYYLDRNGAIVDIDGKQLGKCKAAPEEKFYCGINVGRAEGTRKLDCTSSLGAGDFKRPT